MLETTPASLEPQDLQTSHSPTPTLEHNSEGSFIVTVSTLTSIFVTTVPGSPAHPGIPNNPGGPYLLETETVLEPITLTIPVPLSTITSQGVLLPIAEPSNLSPGLILGNPHQTPSPVPRPDSSRESTPLAPSASSPTEVPLSYPAPTLSATTVDLGGVIYSAFNQGSQSPTINAAGEEITIINPSAIALDGTTLVEGAGVATVSNEILSLGPSDALVVISTSPTAKANAEPPVLTVAGQIVSAAVGSNFIVVGSQTIAAGGPGVTVSGTPISLAASGVVVVGTSSIPIAVPPAVTIESQVYGISSIGSGAILFAGETLKPEGPAVTISGTPVSLGPSNMLIIGTSTVDLAANPVITTVPLAITVGTQVYDVSAIGSGDIVIASQTIIPGGSAITISGVPISLAQSDILIVGTSSVNIAINPAITAGGTEIYLGSQPTASLTVDSGLAHATATTSLYVAGAPFYGDATIKSLRFLWEVVGICILVLAFIL